MATETEFKRWFRRQFIGWSETYEPRHGSAIGMPDVQVLFWGGLLPLELKLGYIENDQLFIHRLRPIQVGWHIRFMQAGGVARLVVGVKQSSHRPGKEWSALAPPWTVESLTRWKEGWAIAECSEWTLWNGNDKAVA
jgi:hypothetical protein